MAKRDKWNRGRISTDEALRHRFFLPELFSLGLLCTAGSQALVIGLDEDPTGRHM